MVQEQEGLDVTVASNFLPIMSSHKIFCNTEVKFFYPIGLSLVIVRFL